jgi:invasion protein IalB
MKNFYKKTESLTKIILLTSLLLFPVLSSADIIAEKWTEKCDKDQKNCSINIKSEYNLKDSDKKQTLATITIRMQSTTEKKMNLLDAEENTYKLSQENKFTPVMFVNLPLNVDLRKNPLIQVDNKNVLNVNYTHCNNQIGCATVAELNNDIINLFKEGKEVNVIIAAVGNNKNMSIKFPLKGFTKSYKKLLK